MAVSLSVKVAVLQLQKAMATAESKRTATIIASTPNERDCGALLLTREHRERDKKRCVKMKQLITEFKNGELIRLCIIDLDKLHETFMREATASQDKFICESDKT